jgi:hypothetical protein
VNYENFRYLEMDKNIFSTILEYLEKPPPRLIKYYKKLFLQVKRPRFLKLYILDKNKIISEIFLYLG